MANTAVMAAKSEDFYRTEIRTGYRSPYFVELAEAVASGKLDPEQWLTSDLPTAELKKEITANGPDAAVKVCKNIGPELAAKLSIEKGWRVTRVSLKTRNPLLGTPDTWEQHALKEFDARAASGEALDKMEFSESVNEPGGRYFRYVKALPVQPLCLSCHGGEEQIPASVKGALVEQYPHDRATGYTIGQVRGAISVKRPLP